MGAFGWATAGAYLILGVIVLCANARPRAQERAVQKFAVNTGLPMPDHLAEPIQRRIVRRRRASTIGGMLGATAALVALIASPGAGGMLAPLVIVAGIFAGWAIGASVSALRTTAEQSEQEGVRFARANAVELGDYISRGELWLARGPVALAVVVVISMMTLAQLGLVRYVSAAAVVSAIALAVVAVGTLVTSEVVGRKVVAMGNHVGSLEDLVWEDAVRALTIRELVGAPVFLGYYCLLMAASPLVVSPADAARPAFAIASLGIAIVTLAIALGMLVSALAVKRHFLRRLWPELATAADNPRPTEAVY